jgi:hypothetical protein
MDYIVICFWIVNFNIDMELDLVVRVCQVALQYFFTFLLNARFKKYIGRSMCMVIFSATFFCHISRSEKD